MNEINLMSVFQAAQRPESTSKIAKFPTHFRSNIVQKQFRVAPIFESHQKFRRKILVGVQIVTDSPKNDATVNLDCELIPVLWH